MAFPNDDNIKFVILCRSDDAPQTLDGLTAAMPDEFPGAVVSRDQIARLLTWLCENNLLEQSGDQYIKGAQWQSFMEYAGEVMVGEDRDNEATLAFAHFNEK